MPCSREKRTQSRSISEIEVVHCTKASSPVCDSPHVRPFMLMRRARNFQRDYGLYGTKKVGVVRVIYMRTRRGYHDPSRVDNEDIYRSMVIEVRINLAGAIFLCETLHTAR